MQAKCWTITNDFVALEIVRQKYHGDFGNANFGDAVQLSWNPRTGCFDVAAALEKPIQVAIDMRIPYVSSKVVPALNIRQKSRTEM